MESNALQVRAERVVAELRSAYPQITTCHTALRSWREGAQLRYSLRLDIRWPQHQSIISGPACGSVDEALQAGLDKARGALSSAMPGLRDCPAPGKSNESEVLAIARHEQIPEIAAAELDHYLVRKPQGEMRLKPSIRGDIAEARARGDRSREVVLKLLLRDFVLTHPQCDERRGRRRGAKKGPGGAGRRPRRKGAVNRERAG